MTFDEILVQVLALLHRQKRISYRALKVRFNLDDEYLEALKEEIIEAQQLAVDENGRILVWSGVATPEASRTEVAPTAGTQTPAPLAYTPPHLAEKILTSRSALEGERKQVTVLFCDLAASTALAARIGPENMHTLLNRFFELALREVHRYEGTINQFLGDGFMALFGAPIAYEDHASRAVLAAVGVQHVLHEHQAELGEPHGVECQFRMGLNTGLVVVGGIGDNLRMDYTAVGDTTNLASRLQQAAAPGTILVSGVTRRLVQGYFHLEAFSPVQVKGKTEPVAIYKVLGAGPRRPPLAARGEQVASQFVGRERERTVLEELWEQVEGGHGQVVGIVGEAGQGKSRLLDEFRQRLAGKRITYLEGRCLSYGSTMPYRPIMDVVRHHCGITEADAPETVHAKVRDALHEVGLDAEASATLSLLVAWHQGRYVSTRCADARGDQDTDVCHADPDVPAWQSTTPAALCH